MEKGNAVKFKNKSLDEIEIDMENIEDDIDDVEGRNISGRNIGKTCELKMFTILLI